MPVQNGGLSRIFGAIFDCLVLFVSFIILLGGCLFPLAVALAKACGHVYRILLFFFGSALLEVTFSNEPVSICLLTIFLIIAMIAMSINMEGVALFNKALRFVDPRLKKALKKIIQPLVTKVSPLFRYIRPLLDILMKFFSYIFMLLGPSIKALSMAVGFFLIFFTEPAVLSNFGLSAVFLCFLNSVVWK